jgi:hypothetical protein
VLASYRDTRFRVLRIIVFDVLITWPLRIPSS